MGIVVAILCNLVNNLPAELVAGPVLAATRNLLRFTFSQAFDARGTTRREEPFESGISF
jgi:hypothetical protein